MEKSYSTKINGNPAICMSEEERNFIKELLKQALTDLESDDDKYQAIHSIKKLIFLFGE